MPRRCTICDHPRREEIDAAIVASEPYRSITERFSVSTGALARHKENHVPELLVKARDAQEAAQADDLLGQVRTLQARALTILNKAEMAGELRTALSAIREARGCLELLGKLAGELHEGQTVNILLNPQWLQTRTAILMALRPFPEARLAVAQALGGTDARS